MNPDGIAKVSELHHCAPCNSSWLTFFCKIVNIPVGVVWLFVPVLTVERPIGRYCAKHTFSVPGD